MDNTRKRIEARKQEARDKRLGNKAECIAKVLGNQTRGTRTPPVTWSYKDANLVIEAAFPDRDHDDIVHTTVEYKGKRVFRQEESKVLAYLLGPWEEDLNTLYSKICETESKRKEAEQANREREDAAALAREAKWFGL